jgi:hypothetical protein
MHIARQTPQELVVVSGSRWVSVICAVAAIFTAYFPIVRNQPKGLFLSGFFLLFAMIMYLRKTFTFDAARRIVRWSGRKVLKTESGEIPFNQIVDIRPQATTSGEHNTMVYRLTIVTHGGEVPMSYDFNGQHDHYSAMREQILKFVRSESST